MADFDLFGQVADWAKGTSNTILGTWLQGRQTRKNMELAQQYNMANYERENADKIAQWQRENAYNDPRAQMERYARAGLNPNLIYGQANESANSPALASMGMYQPPAAPLAVGPSMLDTEQARANIDLTRAQERNLLENTKLTTQEIANAVLTGKATEAQIERWAKENEVDEATRVKLVEETNQIKENIKLIQQQTAKTTQEIENLRADYGLTTAQMLDTLLEAINKQEWYTATIAEIKSRTKLNDTQADMLTRSTLAQIYHLESADTLAEQMHEDDYDLRFFSEQVHAQAELVNALKTNGVRDFGDKAIRKDIRNKYENHDRKRVKRKDYSPKQ